MDPVTPRQKQLIESLLRAREYKETEKTLIVGEHSFRTTPEKIGTISKKTASKLIDALLKAPAKDIVVPHFQKHFGEWVVAAAPDEWKQFDVVEIPLKRGGLKRVILISQLPGNRWSFCDSKATQEADPNQQETSTKQSEQQDFKAAEALGRPRQNVKLATKKQIERIAFYVQQGRHMEGGFLAVYPTTIEEIQKLTKEEASMIISSLESDY